MESNSKPGNRRRKRRFDVDGCRLDANQIGKNRHFLSIGEFMNVKAIKMKIEKIYKQFDFDTLYKGIITKF